MFERLVLCVLLTALGALASGQTQSTPAPSRSSDDQATESKADYDRVAIIARGIEHLLAVQEGEGDASGRAEWPYEGVYRVRGEIPIGYRVGGTGICAMALLAAPGFGDDQLRRDAVARAAHFVCQSASHPLMNPDYEGGYDVRGWGYTYGLAFLLRLKTLNVIPPSLAEQVESTTRFYIEAIEQTAIHEIGGWNYARGQGKQTVSPPSPFMTGPTLQALFEARKLGYQVDAAVVDRALATLERARTASGAICYSGVQGKDGRDAVPGAVGRMVVTEATLALAGRSSVANVRSAVDAFIVHWQWLDKRRAKQGTHAGPYGVAPYYFYYAHYYAAQAVELLPQRERAEYRRRINELILSVRLPDGTWNDRVFERSSNYGTAMCMMALLMPDLPSPARWG